MSITITATNNLNETLTARRYEDNNWHASIKTHRGFTFAQLINEGPDELLRFANDFDFDLEGMVG